MIGPSPRHGCLYRSALAILGLSSAVALAPGIVAGAQDEPAPSEPIVISADARLILSHARHESVGCTACHGMEPSHGTSLIRTVEDCRSCHHSEPVASECVTCHLESEGRDRTYALERTFTLTVAEDPFLRTVSFRHQVHESQACAQCHTESSSLSASNLDCQNCHEQHHATTVSGCSDCHQAPQSNAHPLAVHATCSGSGCHQDSPVQVAPRDRTGCLWCHSEQAEHEPEEQCVLCHLMPAARQTGHDG
jgi:hypothetical protein